MIINGVLDTIFFARVKELIEAVEADLGPKVSYDNLICHRGMTTPDKCGRCSREMRIRNAIQELK